MTVPQAFTLVSIALLMCAAVFFFGAIISTRHGWALAIVALVCAIESAACASHALNYRAS